MLTTYDLFEDCLMEEAGGGGGGYLLLCFTSSSVSGGPSVPGSLPCSRGGWTTLRLSKILCATACSRDGSNLGLGLAGLS